MINWWPVAGSRLESPRYESLTTTERLYMEHIVSEYSLRGPFYRSDLEIAVTLGVSEDKVRRARRRVGRPTDCALEVASVVHRRPLATGFGWVVYAPGWRSYNQNLATQYVDMPIATVWTGDFFASVHRYSFETRLSHVREKLLTHADVVVWLVLSYKYWKCRGKREDHRFFAMKRELSRLSGIANAPSCVEHLHKQFTFKGSYHLFEYSDQYQRLVFSDWISCADLTENEEAAHAQDTRRRAIAQQVLAKKQLMQQRKRSG